MTVGLICAIPEELTHLRANLDGVATVTVGHAEFATGTLDGHDVVLVGSGMGKVNAALVTTLLIDRFDCRSIAFSGIAGGLDPALSVGDVVIADRIVQSDAGMIHDERLEVYQAGHVRFFNPTDELGHAMDPVLAARVRDRLADVYDLFPRLKERRLQEAGTLSGGERQMLAVGRSLMSRPSLLMLDEPSLGLAPLIVKEIFTIIETLRQTGVTIVLVEQNARAALACASKARAAGTKACPAAVSCTPRLLRVNKVAPTEASSCWMFRLKGGCEIDSRWAARPKCSSSASMRK